MKCKEFCPNCQKLRVIFYNGLCRKCYNSNVHKKKKYKSNYKGNDKNVKLIIECFMCGYTKKEIAPRVNRTYRYVCYVIKNYVEEVI